MATLADFGLVFCASGTTAGAGNPVTTPSQVFSSWPNGTGAGVQNINTDPCDSLETIIVVSTQTLYHSARVDHQSDILKRVQIWDLNANAAANGRVNLAIIMPPQGLMSVP